MKHKGKTFPLVEDGVSGISGCFKAKDIAGTKNQNRDPALFQVWTSSIKALSLKQRNWLKLHKLVNIEISQVRRSNIHLKGWGIHNCSG